MSEREDNQERTTHHDSPEPPSRYQPGSQLEPGAGKPGSPSPDDEFESARHLILASQIMALVSLLIGGVVLSLASLIVAIMSYRKVQSSLKSKAAGRPVWQLLRKQAIVAIVMGALALVLNSIALAMIMPVLLDAMQSGDYSSMLGNMQSETMPSEGSSNSTWG